MGQGERPRERDHVGSYDPGALEAALSGACYTATGKFLRDAFIREYVKDFSSSAALARAGVGGIGHKSLISKASAILAEPYVAAKIHELVTARRETDIVSRNQVLARMWVEANDMTNAGKTRVAALAHLAKMLGMMRDIIVDAPAAPQNVMLVPCMSVEQWEIAASQAQMSLKARASSSPVMTPPPPPPAPPGQPTHWNS